MYQKIGPIEIIPGENGSRVPFSTSLLIKGDMDSTLIECGAGKPAFDYITRESNGLNIYLTHYHSDHTWGVSHFPHAAKWINSFDYKKLTDLDEFAKATGITAHLGESKTRDWIENQKKQNLSNNGRPDFLPHDGISYSIYPYNEPIQATDTSMVMLHTPGHTEGICCPYFPEYGVVYVGDNDLTSFGPWYMNADSNIDDFVLSAERTLQIDAKYFVTGHQKGTVEKAEYKILLQRYLDKINWREEEIRKAIQKGIHPKEIVYQEIFYFLKNHKQNPNFLQIEVLGISRHIERLIRQGYSFEDYYQAFLTHFGINEDYLHY